MCTDPTEGFRRVAVNTINSEVESNDGDSERKRLEEKHGQVWNTQELGSEFEVIGFMAPYTVVRRLSDGVKGSMMFQHSPRFYFDFTEDK